MSRRMKIEATARIGTMNRETLAPNGMWPTLGQVAKCRCGRAAAGGQDTHDVEIREG